MALADTLTTREALRRAVTDDIIARCELAAQTIEGGPLDGVLVVSMGTLRDQVSGHLMVALGAPSERHAEVKTPATIFTSALCPECDLPVEITVKLTSALAVDDDGAELGVKAKSKARVHVHGQLSLSETDAVDQAGMDDVVIDDLRLRILGAVYDLLVDAGQAEERGDVAGPITLDAIGVRLEVVGESDRFDLDESLHAYSQLETPLVEIHSEKGSPVTYVLTAAGLDLVDETDESAGDDERDGTDPVNPNNTAGNLP